MISQQMRAHHQKLRSSSLRYWQNAMASVMTKTAVVEKLRAATKSQRRNLRATYAVASIA
jgi:hypothetical protein